MHRCPEQPCGLAPTSSTSISLNHPERRAGIAWRSQSKAVLARARICWRNTRFREQRTIREDCFPSLLTIMTCVLSAGEPISTGAIGSPWWEHRECAGGLRLGGTAHLSSGLPFNVTTGFDDNHD